MNPRLDIVVCAYNEEANLPALLESLEGQTAPKDGFRVIVVDNASTDGTSEIANDSAWDLPILYVHEARLGLNHARNTGYRHAQAEYVAHIDADSRGDKRWVETILAAIEKTAADLLGGPYLPFYAHPKPKWFLDRYNANQKGDQPRFLRDDEYLSGTNMVWRRSVVEALGGFDNQMGLTGRNLARGDEVNLMSRARRQSDSFRIYYEPAAVVYHLTRPETTKLVYWVNRSLAAGFNHTQVWPDDAYSASPVRLLLWLAKTAARTLAKLAVSPVLRNRSKYPYWQNVAYECVLPDFYRLGKLWHPVRHAGAAKKTHRATSRRGGAGYGPRLTHR